jgi:Asp-tRNA(Asn)/Glu-tRNA(Gln) amidotransferase A subunit family amidase
MLRRDLARLLPALALVLTESAPAQRATETAAGLTKEQLRQALALIGLEFKDEYLDLMLPSVTRALTNLKDLRALPIPLDTPPAFRFDPLLPGQKVPAAGPFLATAPAVLPRFKQHAELAFQPVTQLGALLRARRVTSRQLTQMYLDRLKEHSPALTCTVTLTEAKAMEAAAQADREIRQGKIRGPLHGIPYGVKDLFASKGYKTTWGAEPFAEQMLDYDATVIERCDKAGAVLLAKLSMGALAMGGQWFGGLTKTPWNLEQTSSGSSAGSGAATAAGLVGFAIGTETLGSIVTPSTRCGITGLRPTFGRVSRHGAMALSWTMDKVGPMTRSVADAMLVLRAIQGPDPLDATTQTRAPLAWAPGSPLGRLKIGVLQADFDKIESAERKRIYTDALASLAKAGAKLTPMALPEFPLAGLLLMLNAEGAAAFDDITRDDRVALLSGQRASDWPNSFRSSRTIPAVEYIRSARARTLLMQTWAKFQTEWDVLVSPTGSPSLTMTNLTGHPQMVVPCGFVNGNEPAGLLFTGRLYEEGKMARAAHAFQATTKWHTLMPPLFKV